MSYTPSTFGQVSAQQRTILSQVYAWMTAGLLVTAAIAFATARSSALLDLIYGTSVYPILVMIELVVVWFAAPRINRMSPAAAITLFLGFAALNGLTLASIFLNFSLPALGTTFTVTAGTFGIMSAYGYATRRDLTTLGNLAFMGLIGIILASIVNLFLRNATLGWIVSYIGILVFVGLTAAHTQRLKQVSAESAQAQQAAIHGALMLYLDFINLFLLLLRFFGNRRD